MRKLNSEFHTAFLSNEGTQLTNGDYYGCVELDNFACYIIADGIETSDEAQSARLAVDAVAVDFSTRPAMSSLAIRGYLRKAHESLLYNSDNIRMKASITVVVTDYVKFRYGHLGNTRLSLFREGYQIHESRDQSLSQQLALRGELPKDKIAQHEERGNLTNYLGKRGDNVPVISRKLKLRNGDIIALYTRGIWEHCDGSDLSSAFCEAGKDPQEAVELAERLILDMHPDEIDNYTLAVIFVDKIFIDPNKSQKLKKILMIAIPIVLILLILGIILFFRFQKIKENRQNMELYFISGIEYIQDGNFVKAKEELQKAHDLALELKDSARSNEISKYQKLDEAIINADELLTKEEYDTAVEGYLNARERSAFTDNLGKNHIESKLAAATGYINVHDMLALGDTLMDQDNFAMAEEKYLAARSLASQIYYSEGKAQALESLNALYEKMSKQVEEGKEQSQSEITATDLAVKASTAFQSGDLVGAQLYYKSAKEKYAELENEDMVKSMEEKLKLVEQKQAENAEQLELADSMTLAGDKLIGQKKYLDAKKQYIYAREVYAALGEDALLNSVKAKIEIADGYLTQKTSSGKSD